MSCDSVHEGLVPRPSPVSVCSAVHRSAYVYYTEHKPKNKYRGEAWPERGYRTTCTFACTRLHAVVYKQIIYIYIYIYIYILRFTLYTVAQLHILAKKTDKNKQTNKQTKNNNCLFFFVTLFLAIVACDELIQIV